MEEQVVVVDQNNLEQYIIGKLEAHQKGYLHRAVSALIFNKKGELLIQQRSEKKYHWPLIWCNSCCSHPRPGESFEDAITRRVEEELGVRCILEEKFHFIYRAVDTITQLIEHEYDMVYFGKYDGKINFNKDEIKEIKWTTIDSLEMDISLFPEKYSFWFKEILKKIKEENIK